MRSTTALVFVIAVGAAQTFAPVKGVGVAVRTVSTRPDMVSGGDVLVEIVSQADPKTSAPSAVAITVNGRDASTDLTRTTSATTLVARIKDLRLGPNVVEVGIRGQKRTARLAIVNHPIAGPVLSGPRQTPFACETQALGLGAPIDADCTIATRVEYFYRSQQQRGNPFKPYDINGPKPADLATTTTLDGRSVPYIVRREMGTINRAVYLIAFLHEPGTPLPEPGSTNGSSWNGRLVYTFGAGCRAGYHQGRTVGGLLANRNFLEESQLVDYPLAKGYAIASSSLNVFDTSCADVISAETMMMVKEHFIEQYGVPRYTIGSGRSGGSMQQQLIANNYPGLLDGIIPTASFADTLTFVTHMADCELLDHAFDTTTLAWTDDQKAAVAGEATWSYCAGNGRAFPILRPGYCDRTGVPADLVFDAKTNPKGTRCTYQDNLVNVFGRDPAIGFAPRPIDNVGFQYGLRALTDGKITVEQFIDLNSRIGGHDIDGRVVATRTTADPAALRTAFQSGRVNDAAQGLAMIPIIDVRPYTDGTGDVHDIVNSHITRARLLAANGTSGNQVLHTYAPGIFMDRVQPANLDEIDRWLAAIAKDTAPAKSPLEKVIRNRPTTVTDACHTKNGETITDMRRCADLFPAYANPRLNAGQPMGATLLKCELKPVERKDYPAALTTAQFDAIKAAFPSGVCDFTRKGVAVRAPDTWVSYGDGSQAGR
ncbi:MAG TPA: DUF6351 family protein [Vicinamibacterales bacterium]